MVTADERMKILQMLQESKISPDAAAQLLEALDEEKPAGKPDFPVETSPSIQTGRKARWLRVRVTDTNSGKPRVNVRMPIGLVNLGMKLGAKYAPEIEGLDMVALLEAAQSGESGPFVDVYDDDDGEHVEVFLE